MWLSRKPKRNIVVGAAAGYLVAASNYTPADGATIAITAQLVDANNHNVATAGKIVTWSEPGGATGSFGAPTSTTDATGLATVNFTVSASPAVSTTVKATDNSTPTPLTGTSPTITTQGAAAAADAYFADGYFATAFAGAGYFS